MKKGLKKTLVCLSWLTVFALWGCSNVLVSNQNNNMCDSVKEYLSNADFEWKGQQVHKWDSIVVDYIGRLADGTVFDTSIESVAKWCGKYAEGRDYSAWLAFEVWAGQMIAGFDRWVEWMKIWQTKTIEIAPSEAYGEWNKELDFEIEKSKLQDPWQYEVWLAFYDENGYVVRVYKETEDKVYLTYNHELAWETLIFDITIKEIK